MKDDKVKIVKQFLYL